MDGQQLLCVKLDISLQKKNTHKIQNLQNVIRSNFVTDLRVAKKFFVIGGGRGGGGALRC